MIAHIASFLGCAALIFFSGKRLSIYGDIIAEKSGLGRVWIGLILMASVTSLPELVVGISSVTTVASSDLAVGDVLGSCVFNLAILSLLDATVHQKPLSGRLAATNHVLIASLGSVLLALVGIALYLPDDTVILGWIGLMSVAFTAVYFVSMRLLYTYERKHPTTTSQEHDGQSDSTSPSLRRALVGYGLNASVVIAAAIILPTPAEHIAAQTSLGESFVGTLLLAASTSLPEIAVSLAAVRMGALDLAVSNLLGSNIFNVFILAIDDICYTNGNLLKDASDSHLISVFAIIMMNSIAIVGLAFQIEKKRFLLAADSFLIFLVYIANIVLLYQYR